MRNFLLEELSDALDDRSGQYRYFFLISSGRVEPYAADDPAAASAHARADAAQIHPISHADAHRLILDFIETLADGELADRLRSVASGSGTHGRFLQVLGAYPRARRSWLSFRQRRLAALALDWLRDNGVELGNLGLDRPPRPEEEAVGLSFDESIEPRLARVRERALALAGRVSNRNTAEAPVLEEMRRSLRLDEVFHSNALRGNRLTREQTAELLRASATVGGLTLREHLEAVNLNRALEHAELLAESAAPITERAIRELHARLFAGIDDETAGVYRRTDARVVGRDYLPPESALVPALVRECAEWLDETDADPVAKAAAVQAKILNIAPFWDGNGRVGRALTNMVLHASGYPPAIVRVEDQKRYASAMRQADEGNMTELLVLTTERVEDALARFESIGG